MLDRPAIVLPLVALLVSGVSAAVGTRLAAGAFHRRAILLATAAATVLCLGGFLAYCSPTPEPYFLFELQPVSGWGEITLVAYSTFVAVSTLVVGFICGLLLGVVWRRR